MQAGPSGPDAGWMHGGKSSQRKNSAHLAHGELRQALTQLSKCLLSQHGKHRRHHSSGIGPPSCGNMAQYKNMTWTANFILREERCTAAHSSTMRKGVTPEEWSTSGKEYKMRSQNFLELMAHRRQAIVQACSPLRLRTTRPPNSRPAHHLCWTCRVRAHPVSTPCEVPTRACWAEHTSFRMKGTKLPLLSFLLLFLLFFSSSSVEPPQKSGRSLQCAKLHSSCFEQLPGRLASKKRHTPLMRGACLWG